MNNGKWIETKDVLRDKRKCKIKKKRIQHKEEIKKKEKKGRIETKKIIENNREKNNRKWDEEGKKHIKEIKTKKKTRIKNE